MRVTYFILLCFFINVIILEVSCIMCQSGTNSVVYISANLFHYVMICEQTFLCTV